MINLLEKPTPPADGSCCESACNPCVWDFYYKDLKEWRLQQSELLKAAAEIKTEK